MSTDLYGIRVLATNPKEQKVTIKVFVVYYDPAAQNHQPLPKDPSFFLRILWDKGDTRFGKGGPIGDEISVNQIGDEKWVDKNTFRFIKNVDQIATANFPLEDYTNYADFYYERNGSWEDEDKLVQATYEIEVTDSKYLAHLSTGMSWGTTSYETQALQVSHNHLSRLPDIANPVIQLNPFEDRDMEDSIIADALFSKDSTHFFALSESGELVGYQTDNWAEVWRKRTEVFCGKIGYDGAKQLIWVQDNYGIPMLFNFAGEMVAEKIWPETDKKLYKAFRSPLGNYFLLPDGSGGAFSIYDAKGMLLWEYENENRGELFTTFFNNEEKILVLETRQPNTFKTLDLKTGAELSRFEIAADGLKLTVDPTNQFFSFRTSTGTKIVELAHGKTLFEYGTKPYNGDYLSPCIWSSNNQFAAFITIGEGKRRNNGFGGHVTIYPIGIKGL